MNRLLSDSQAQLAAHLWELGAIELNSQRPLKSDERSSCPMGAGIYINLRDCLNAQPGPLTVADYDLIADVMYEQLTAERCFRTHFEYIVGVPGAGEPIAAALVRRFAHLGVEQLFLEQSILPNGQSCISRLKPSQLYDVGATVLLVDDLVTAADSKLEAIRALEHESFYIEDVAVLIDRMQGGREALTNAGFRLHAPLSVLDLLLFFGLNGQMTRDEVFAQLSQIRSRRAA